MICSTTKPRSWWSACVRRVSSSASVTSSGITPSTSEWVIVAGGSSGASEQPDADLGDAAVPLGPGRDLACEEGLVEVGEGLHADPLGPFDEVVVVEQPRGRDLPRVLEELAPVDGNQVARAGGDRGRPGGAERTARSARMSAS